MRAVAKWVVVVVVCASAGLAGQTKATRRAAAEAPAVTADDLRALREQIAALQQVTERMQADMRQRDEAIRSLQEELHATRGEATQARQQAVSAGQAGERVVALQEQVDTLKLNQTNAAISTQEDQKRVTALEGLVGRFRLSGDVRVRGESFLQDGAADRHRARIRLRLGTEGRLNDDFSAGVYFAGGANTNGAPTFFDPVSTNETLTSFFERKTVGFDRGWITYNPQAHKWLSLTGGKFAYPWQRTILTFDNDLNPEGFSEKFSFDLRNMVVKNLTLFAEEVIPKLRPQKPAGAKAWAASVLAGET